MSFVEFNNVFEALGSNEVEPYTHRLRSDLMMTIEDIIKEKELSPADAADLFGVKQIIINDLLSGMWRKFTLDMLITMLAHADVMVELTVRTKKAA